MADPHTSPEDGQLNLSTPFIDRPVATTLLTIGLALAAGPERWTAIEGGVPVLVDGQCIGGVGVSGGDWETDLRIAKAAVDSIGASWK